MNQKKKLNKLKIYTDGGARGNPGPAGIGVHATAQDSTIFQLSEYIGETTNNVAEWQALIKALEHIKEKNIQVNQLDFYLDSMLVVKQVKREYKVKKPHLQKLFIKAHQLLQELESTKVSFYHIPRDKNKIADSLANQALDALLK